MANNLRKKLSPMTLSLATIHSLQTDRQTGKRADKQQLVPIARLLLKYGWLKSNLHQSTIIKLSIYDCLYRQQTSVVGITGQIVEAFLAHELHFVFIDAWNFPDGNSPEAIPTHEKLCLSISSSSCICDDWCTFQWLKNPHNTMARATKTRNPAVARGVQP